MQNTPIVKNVPVGIGSKVRVQAEYAVGFGPVYVLKIFQPTNELALLGLKHEKSNLNKHVAVVYIPRFDSLEIVDYALLKNIPPRTHKKRKKS